MNIIIFRMRRSWGEMCIGHGRLCVSLCECVCPSPHCHTTVLTWM